MPQRALKDFLLQYSLMLCDQFAPAVSEAQLRAFVTDVLTDNTPGPAQPADVVLEFKHVCRFSACNHDDCQLCRNNPSKVCEASNVFDRQYWVRDDGKGGQVIKARCGAEVSLGLTDRATGQAVLLPGVTLKLYVVSGHNTTAVGLTEPPGGLYLADDGHPLFAAGGCVPDDEGGIPLELTQDESLGPVAHLPELQFLDKNSKFKCGGRTFKAFKLLARALQTDPATGLAVVIGQVESDTFKVTTKKGYDGCRKAEYLFAHQAITDKTFATLGETTISNLKSTFEGVETVEDLMRLVQASASAPELQARLRDTLNMARDTDKWKKLTRMLSERVVWDDSITRLFVLPTGKRPLGLLFRANKGQVDVEGAIGVVCQPPLPTGQLRAVRTADRSLSGCGRHIDALKQLAASYWGLPKHPGWTLAPEQPKWEHGGGTAVPEAFAEVVGQGDPVAAAETYWMQLAATLQAGSGPTGSAGPSPLRSPTPLSSDNHAAAVAAVMAAADTNGLLSGGSLGVAPGSVQDSGNHTAGLAAAGMPGLLPRVGGSGAVVSPFEGSNAINAMAAAVAAAAGGAGAYAAAGGFNGSGLAPGQAGGLNRPSGLLVGSSAQAGGSSGAMMLVSPAGQAEPSPYSLQATSMLISGRTTSCATEQTSDTGSLSTQNQQQTNAQAAQLQQQQQMLLQQQQQQLQQMQVQLGARGGARSLGLPPSMSLGPMSQGMPGRTVSGPVLGPSTAAAAAGGLGGVPGSSSAAAAYGGMPGSYAGLELPAAAGPSSSGGNGGGPSGLSSQQGFDPLTLQGLGPASGGTARQQQLPNQGPFASLQQQQQVAYGSKQLSVQQLQTLPAGMSSKTLLLQQAIVESWPAPQVKALLDQMTDEELQQLVELHAASEAAAAAAAGGGGGSAGMALPATAALQPTQAGAAAGNLQGFGSTVPLLGNSSGLASAGQQPKAEQQQQQRQGAAAGAAAVAAGDSGAALPKDTAAAALAALFADAGVAPGGDLRAMSDVQLTGDQGPPLALDSFTGDLSQWGGDIFGDLRNFSTGSGTQPGSLTGKNSFTTDWIPELLSRRRDGSSGRLDPVAAAVAGAAVGGGSTAGAAVKGAAQQQEQQAGGQAGAAAASAAAASAAAASAAAVAGGTGAAGAAAADGGDVSPQAAAGADAGGAKGRKGKRERSKTGQAPTVQQRQEWQALFGGEDGATNPELRSLSKAEGHYDSFNRHFPVARLTSKTAEVQQGGQVANPFEPGQRLSTTGVGHHPAAVLQPYSTPGSPNPFAEQQVAGSPMVVVCGSPNTRAPVTTESPQAPERSRMVSGDLDAPGNSLGRQGLPSIGELAPAAAAAGEDHWGAVPAPAPVAPLAQTEEGAAAVEAVTGLRSGSQPEAGGPEGSAPSGGLRGILDLMSSDAAAAADGPPGAAGQNAYLSSQRTDSDAAAVAAAAAAENPFAVAGHEPMHPPAPQLRESLVHRDSFGRTGWISSLFRRSSSWSSKSGSGVLGSGGSGSGPSGGSHSSKDPVGAAVLARDGSVRGPLAGPAAAAAAPNGTGTGNGQ